MASTGKNYKIEVGLYADTKKSQTNIQNALKVIQSKISDIKLNFDVDTAKIKELNGIVTKAQEEIAKQTDTKKIVESAGFLKRNLTCWAKIGKNERVCGRRKSKIVSKCQN